MKYLHIYDYESHEVIGGELDHLCEIFRSKIVDDWTLYHGKMAGIGTGELLMGGDLLSFIEQNVHKLRCGTVVNLGIYRYCVNVDNGVLTQEICREFTLVEESDISQHERMQMLATMQLLTEKYQYKFTISSEAGKP